MKTKLYIVICLLGCLCTSCSLHEITHLFYEPVFVLRFHEFSDPQLATRLVSNLRGANFDVNHVVKKYSFLNSKNILGGEAVGPYENGKYALRLMVDRWNLGNLHLIAGNYFGMPYAINLDGIFVGISHFNRGMRDSNVFETDPVFTEHDALMIVSNIEDNYNYYNKR